MNNCPICGGNIIGDGITVVYHCEFVDISDIQVEPDSNIILCDSDFRP